MVSRRRVRARCRDCRVDTFDLSRGAETEYYMVHPEVWAQAGMTSAGGFLCIGCLSARLGRHLDGRDLTDCVINRPDVGADDTPRLHALKLAAALARFIRGEPGW